MYVPMLVGLKVRLCSCSLHSMLGHWTRTIVRGGIHPNPLGDCLPSPQLVATNMTNWHCLPLKPLFLLLPVGGLVSC